MLQEEHSAILLTFIKLPFVIRFLSIFEWPFYRGFTHDLHMFTEVLHMFYTGFTHVLHMFTQVLHMFYTCLHMFCTGFTVPFLFFLLPSPSEIHTLR